MLSRLRKWAWVLPLLFAACTPPPPQANTTPEEAATGTQSALLEVQAEIQNLLAELDRIFSGSFTGLGLSAGALEPLAQPGRWLTHPFGLLARPLDLVPLATQGLPRGQFQCQAGNCSSTGSSDDLVIRYRAQETDPWNKALADWDYSTKGSSSPTVEAHLPGNTSDTNEVPTKAFFALDLGDDGSNQGEATLSARWRPSTCLPGKYLTEPESLRLQGFLDHPTGTARLVDLRTLEFTSSNTQVGLSWDLALNVTGNESALATRGGVTVNGSANPGTCGSLMETFSPTGGSLDVELSTRTHSLHLAFQVPRVEENPTRIHVQNGYLTVDGKTVTFDGILDDENGNCVPGENLTLRFANNQTMTLEAFLIQHMDARPCP